MNLVFYREIIINVFIKEKAEEVISFIQSFTCHIFILWSDQVGMVRYGRAAWFWGKYLMVILRSVAIRCATCDLKSRFRSFHCLNMTKSRLKSELLKLYKTLMHFKTCFVKV